MKSLRIAIFDDLPEGGAKRVVFEHVKGFSAEHQVYYFSNQIPSRFPFEQYAQEVYRFPLSLWPLRGAARLLQESSYYLTYKFIYQKISSLIKQLNVDILILHPSKLTQCPELVHTVKIPVIYFAHEWNRLVYEPEKHPLPPGIAGSYESNRRQWLQRLDYYAVRAASRVVTTSHYNRGRIHWAYAVDSDVVPLGVDTNVFTASTHDRRYFIFIGDKHPLNGADLLAADPSLPVKFVTFNKAKFRYSDRELAKLYANAYASICLGRNEPFGLTPLESMACETPVIALAEGGYTETVVHGKTGWLVSPCPDSIKTAMEYVLKSPQILQSYGAAGKLHVAAHFRWESHILELERIVREVCHDQN